MAKTIPFDKAKFWLNAYNTMLGGEGEPSRRKITLSLLLKNKIRGTLVHHLSRGF